MENATERPSVNDATELEQLFARIKLQARERGLVVVSGLPDKSGPTLDWKGDPTEFLDVAAAAGVSIVYLREHRYVPDDEIEEVMDRHGFGVFDDDEIEDENPSAVSAHQWLHERCRDAVGPWDSHRDELAILSCEWFKDGVAHFFDLGCEWFSAALSTLVRTVEDAREVERQDRVVLRQEEAVRLHELASQMARHERFPEASNDAKRHFMAQQLFPDEDYRRIVERATLIYWWEVEPEERVTKTEQVRELYQNGESIKNIAAIMKMSEARVRTALGELLAQ